MITNYDYDLLTQSEVEYINSMAQIYELLHSPDMFDVFADIEQIQTEVE